MGPSLSPSPTGAGAEGRGHAGGIERADHLPRAQAAGAPFDAAGGLPGGNCQCFRFGGGRGRARGATSPLPGRRASCQRHARQIAMRMAEKRAMDFRLPGHWRIALYLAVSTLVVPTSAWPQAIAKELAAKLTPTQQETYLGYRRARTQFESQHRAYWHKVEGKRDVRKAKRIMGQAYSVEDYVAQYPPKYAGPELPADIAKIVSEMVPPIPERPLPTVTDFLAHAKEQYGFVPTPTTERDFKRRYAQE